MSYPSWAGRHQHNGKAKMIPEKQSFNPISWLDALSLQSKISMPSLEVLGLRRFPSALQKTRLTMLSFRVTAASVVFAFLTLLWSLVDSLAFPAPVWISLFKERCVVTFCLILIAIITSTIKKLPVTLVALVLMLTTLCIFFIFGRPPESVASYSFFGRIVVKSFALLPYTLISCLGLFPLTMIESLIALSALVSFCATATFYFPLSSPIAYGLDGLWLLILLGLIASLSSLSQVQLIASQNERNT